MHEPHRLRDEVPCRGRIAQTPQKPAALIGAEHRPRWVDARGAVARRRLVQLPAERDLGRAVLTGVEDEERRELAVRDAPVQLEVGPPRPRSAHGQVLVEGLVTRGSLGDRKLVAGLLLVDAARVIVLHLMVVPGDDPRERRVRRLKIPVRLVLRVAVAVVGEAVAPPTFAVLANDVAARGPLVDVVAEKEDRMEILAG